MSKSDTAEHLWQRYFNGEYAQVVENCDQRIGPIVIDLHLSGLCLAALGKTADAKIRLRAACGLAGGQPHLFGNAAVAMAEREDWAASEEFARSGLARHPKDPSLLFLLGNAFLSAKRFAEAVEVYQTCLSLKPDHLDAMVNLGNAIRRVEGRSAEAFPLYEEVLRQDPNRHDALINMTGLLMDRGDEAKAEGFLMRARALRSTPEAEFLYGMLRLAFGDYAEGWKHYHHRWDCAMTKADRSVMTRPIARSKEEMAGKRVLLLHEQGFGDTLQFIRYAALTPPLAGSVTALVPKPLLRLASVALEPHNIPVVTTRAEVLGGHDLEVPFLDLPFHLGTATPEEVPATLPYFRVPASVADERRLPPPNPEKPLRVGLCWAGQARPDPDLKATDARRSMHIDALAPLADVPGVEFVSLQMGDPAQQLADSPTWSKVGVLTPLKTGFDFLDTAAIIDQLDLVISVDTSVCHLAGGLNKPIWVLSRYDICWRWLRGRTDSPWYPEVLRLFIQRTPGDWTSVVAQVRDALAERAAR